jgi:hypothetical protein
LVNGRDLDRVHDGIHENHTSKIDLDSGSDLVNFGSNLFGSQITPIFVILVAESSFLPTRRHNKKAQYPSTTPLSGAHLQLFWRKKNIKLYFWTKHCMRKNISVSVVPTSTSQQKETVECGCVIK